MGGSLHGVGLLAIHIDPDLAGHLAVAVRRHREVCDRLGYAYPTELAELEETLAGIAHGGPERPRMAPAGNSANVRGVDHDWFSPAEAVIATGLSPRTIRRRIADGSLSSSKIGRCRRIARADLDDFMRSERVAT